MTKDSEATPARSLPWRRSASAIGAALLLALTPKCPLCVAAYLVSLGVGARAAHSAAPFIQPLAWSLMLVALGALALGLRSVSQGASQRGLAPLPGARQAG